MIRFACLTALTAIMAHPVAALSCLVPDVARSTQEAIDADARYRIVSGTFTFDARIPPFDGTPLPDGQTVRVPARFGGAVLTDQGFTQRLTSDVTLNVDCMMQSCGSLAQGTETLAFLRMDGDALTLDLGPCPQWVFPAPTAAQKQTVVDCVAGDCPAG